MFYKHYKGNYYQMIATVFNVHSEETMICYTPLYPCKKRYFVRNKTEFFEILFSNGNACQRFAPITIDSLPTEAQLFIVNPLP